MKEKEVSVVEQLKQVDPEFDGRLPRVKRWMKTAINEYDAQVADTPDGKRIVFPEDSVGRSIGRLNFIHSIGGRGNKKDRREAFDAMPWGLFEDTIEKSEKLKNRVGLRINAIE